MKLSIGLVSIVITAVGALASIYVAATPGLRVEGFDRPSVFNVTAFTTAFGALLGLIAAIRYRQNQRGGVLGGVSIAAAVLGGIGSILAGVASTPAQYSHGRPFRRRGKNRTAATAASDLWLLGGASLDDVPEALRAELAEEWRSNGAKEHASIAAFSRLALDLLAVGAPPALIAEVQRDALDEVRHAQLCFSIARDLDGRAEGPTTFPEARERPRTLPTRTLALAQLAIDAVIDGALNEGVSARILARLGQRSAQPRLTEALRTMAADEARHAAHSWNIISFCIEAGGQPVVDALRGALRSLPELMTAQIPDGARGGAWEAFGVQGEALEHEAWTSTRRHGVAKLRAMLA